MPEPRDGAAPAGSRRPGTRSRRVVSAPTGAPGEVAEAPVEHGGGAVAPRVAAPAAGTADPAWEAEAERLRRDRPPHWG